MIDSVSRVPVRLLPWDVPTWLGDLVVLGVMGVALTARDDTRLDITHPAEVVALVLGVVAIFVRRRFPIPTLATALVTLVVVVTITGQPTTMLVVTIVVLYTVASSHDWRIALAAGALTTVVIAAVVTVLIEDGELGSGALAALAWPAFAAAIGTAVRSSRANLSATQERARRAEQTRELEAERRVVEERLRIARDVHDVVAHHLAVVNVQSGVAGHVLRSDPDAAETALAAVRESASTAVGELGDLLGVLRDASTGEPVDPTPDLEAVEDLIGTFAASGLRVENETAGSPRPLSRTAQITAYRVIQEALTNAHKHGDGTAALRRSFDDGGLEIEVSNRHDPGRGEPASSAAGSTGGYGLIGMRERVEAVGGALHVEQRPDRFTVIATIPSLEDA